MTTTTTTPEYQAPKQSPDWDNVMPLAQMMAGAKFFLLRKGLPHGDLVDLVRTIEWVGDDLHCQITALSHDSVGITYTADGSTPVRSIVDDVRAGSAAFTNDPERVLRYIWEYMTCHPNAEAKFFTKP